MGAHSSQYTLPQNRQWCLRSTTENLALQPWQLSTSASSTHADLGIMVPNPRPPVPLRKWAGSGRETAETSPAPLSSSLEM
jgi:hypothetical protein